MPGMRVAMGTQIDWSVRQAASISIKGDRGNQILGGGKVQNSHKRRICTTRAISTAWVVG